MRKKRCLILRFEPVRCLSVVPGYQRSDDNKVVVGEDGNGSEDVQRKAEDKDE